MGKEGGQKKAQGNLSLSNGLNFNRQGKSKGNRPKGFYS